MVWVTPAKSRVSTFHWRLFDLQYFVSIEKRNLSSADSALHRLLQILLRYPASFIKGHLLLLNVILLLNFPKFQKKITCNATQGCIQLVAEVKSLDNLHSPGGKVCYWLKCSGSPLKNSLAVLDPHSLLIARNSPGGTAFSFTDFTKRLQIYPGVNYIRGRPPSCVLTAPIYLQMLFFFPLFFEGRTTKY